MTVLESLKIYATPEKAINSARFFKTGPGQYGEGDKFLGVTVPESRKVAKQFKDISISDAIELLKSPYHECRIVALLILVDQFKKAGDVKRKEIFNAYLKASNEYINNWDMVDCSAEYIVGESLGEDYEPLLNELANSDNLWRRRIAVLATFNAIKLGDPKPAFYVIDLLKNDKHDLIQKAVGWMLREIGKRCSRQILVEWLNYDNEYQKLPRTTLRYAIEHFDPDVRKKYLTNQI